MQPNSAVGEVVVIPVAVLPLPAGAVTVEPLVMRFAAVGRSGSALDDEYDTRMEKINKFYDARIEEGAVHHGVVCNRSGMEPIVGTRYHLPSQDYDLCQAEWDKLPPQEQATYECIDRPGAL